MTATERYIATNAEVGIPTEGDHEKRIPFEEGAGLFAERMARGHFMRLGHALEGYYTVDSEDIYHLHRTCCERAS